MGNFWACRKLPPCGRTANPSPRRSGRRSLIRACGRLGSGTRQADQTQRSGLTVGAKAQSGGDVEGSGETQHGRARSPKKKSWGELKGQWTPRDTRDQVIDFVGRWSRETEIAVCALALWLGLRASKFYGWRARYGRVNEHNARVPRGGDLGGARSQAGGGATEAAAPASAGRREFFARTAGHRWPRSDRGWRSASGGIKLNRPGETEAGHAGEPPRRGITRWADRFDEVGSARSRTRGTHAPVPHCLVRTSSNDRPLGLENSRRQAPESCSYEKSPALHFRLNQDIVRFQKRAHNPLLLAARFEQTRVSIPWLGGKQLRIEFD